MQIQLTGFLDKDTPTFCKELWKLLLSGQASPQGVPKELLEAKKLELMQEKVGKTNSPTSHHHPNAETDTEVRSRRIRQPKKPASDETNSSGATAAEAAEAGADPAGATHGVEGEMIETGAGSDAGGPARRPASASVVSVVVEADVEGLVVVAAEDGSGISTFLGETRPDAAAHPGGAAVGGAMTDVAGPAPGPAPGRYRSGRPHPVRSRAAPASSKAEAVDGPSPGPPARPRGDDNDATHDLGLGPGPGLAPQCRLDATRPSGAAPRLRRAAAPAPCRQTATAPVARRCPNAAATPARRAAAAAVAAPAAA
jgi:hypothetical protein